ncbi:MAG: prepilin-type N-terminal cleavage/methylation domain-containing protein [Myxococcales bacterium]|nr:prepilin-type N-terminal cleavage/methylation domain-containing protein [Myxococcales bacterium]
MQKNNITLRAARLRRQRRRRRQQGMTLIEIMIVMVIMAMVAVAAGFAIMPSLVRARVRQARIDARTIGQAVTAYQLEFGSECPSVETLVKEDILSRRTNSVDPWGNAFHIECDESEATVVSAGANGQLGDDDDIR